MHLLRLDRLHEQFAVLYVDLDDFKNINDKLGHATGDNLLVQVGQRLTACARDVDLVARLSGDEFAVIVASATESSTALALANRIVSSLDAPFLIDGITVFARGMYRDRYCTDRWRKSRTSFEKC